MILRFLRLFWHVRALEENLDRSTARANDREAAYQSEFNERIAAERKAMQFEHELAEARAALQEENQRALLLQDRLESSQESVSRLWEMVDDAQKRAYRAMEMQVNFSTQQRFGITPYPEATQLPPSLEPDLDTDHTVRRRMMPSEAIAAQTRKLRDQVVDRLMPKATA